MISGNQQMSRNLMNTKLLTKYTQEYFTRYFHSDQDPSFKYWETKLKDDSSEIGKYNDKNSDFMYKCDIQSYKHVSNETSDINLTHVDSQGKAKMVDVGTKQDTTRVARATATIVLGENAFSLLKENKIKKGDVLSVANIAGIMGAKNTCHAIPLCHNIPLSTVSVDFLLDNSAFSVVITSEVKTFGKTGVEIEAIMAVSIAACTIYDMCKAVTKAMVITDVKLIHKSGGTSGNYHLEQHETD